MGNKIEVCVPDIGDFHDVEVVELFPAVGDAVAAGESIITIESDKATMEIPSPANGKVVDIRLKIGDKVSEGASILLLEAEEVTTPAPDAEATLSAPEAHSPIAPPRGEPVGGISGVHREIEGRQPALARPAAGATVDDGAFRRAHASPATRRFARELGADIGRIQGTGPKGRILKEDVKAWIKQNLAAASEGRHTAGGGIPSIPQIDFSQFGPVEEVALSRIKRISGPHLHRAWLNIPMVTIHDEVDITDLEDFRASLREEAEQQGVRVTTLVFIIKALVDALHAFPRFNASLAADGQTLICKKYFNIGIAVDTSDGLVVPVIREADRKSIFQLSDELAQISANARNGRLTLADLSGGCMSISNLGGIHGRAFNPIINSPEVAILGVSRARMQPVWNGVEFIPRLMMPLDLTFDHRVIDGAEAARFCARISRSLGDIRRLLL